MGIWRRDGGVRGCRGMGGREWEFEGGGRE